MGYNKSPLAFDDVLELFERALNSPKGLRIPCEDRSAAVILRSRFHYYRAVDREKNSEIYPQDNPMWRRSAYDRLILRIGKKGAPDEAVLYIQRRSAEDMVVEEIQ